MWCSMAAGGDMGIGGIGREAAADLGLDVEDGVRDPTGDFPWTSRLPVSQLALDSVALASLAANRVAAARTGGRPAPVRVDASRVAASFGSEKLLRIDGRAPSVWAPLSGFWRAADGWVRTHANYAHHEAALRRLLGLDAGAGPPEMAAAVAARGAVELEEAAADGGAVVGAVRDADTWRTHPQARAVAGTRLIERRRVGESAPRGWMPGGAPLTGIRVLDLTRVLAGPVAARDLALAGAEVLRVDSPRLPETEWIHLDTGQGKRSTLLDLAAASDRARFEELLASADVLLTGYRPGALDRFGLGAEAVAERHPGIVTASVSAWGDTGPWAHRRGFDSIVQAVTGIATTESADGVAPGALPVQALDHSTGHFLAAAIMAALIEQRRTGGSLDVRMSLARTAQELLSSTDAAAPSADVALPTTERRIEGLDPVTVETAAPVLAFARAPADAYPRPGGRWGVDPPEWSA
jgi:hypothetical protein